jgi:hypothetical protein
MPQGRCWIVTELDGTKWEVETAREGEVYHRPLDESGRMKGGWRAGLPPLSDLSVLPQSLRDVLDVFIAAQERAGEEPC